MEKPTVKFKETEIGPIPRDWEVVKISNVLSLEYGKALKEVNRNNGNVAVYGSNGITGYHDKKLVDGPGIVVGRKGSAGEVIYSEADFFPIDTTYYVKTDLGYRFVYYLLKNSDLKKLVGSSAVPGLNRNDVYSQEVIIPKNKDEQKRIAEILSSLDGKIELNRKMNENLEKIASALFKKWFVDIARGEPVESGEKLPEGWRKGKFEQLAKVTSGKRPSEIKDIATDVFKIPLLGASSIVGYVKDYLYNEPLLITGRVGTHGVIQKVHYPCWPSDNTLVIQSKYLEFVYQTMKNIDFASLNRGSTQSLITQGDINNIEIIIPDDAILENFEKVIAPFAEMMRNSIRNNFWLSQIRDSLLPRLMSGKISLNK